MTLRLEPLGQNEIDELIAERVPQELRERIARTSGGNPLFALETLKLAWAEGALQGGADLAQADDLGPEAVRRLDIADIEDDMIDGARRAERNRRGLYVAEM